MRMFAYSCQQGRSGSEQRRQRSASRGENNTMKYCLFAVSAALIVATASIGLEAQTPPKAQRVEVDPNWPQIPNNWVLGEVTSISVDRNDRIWVLHVPQSIPEAQRANAAPPVLQFDATGKLLTSWGGPGGGTVWPGRAPGHFLVFARFHRVRR